VRGGRGALSCSFQPSQVKYIGRHDDIDDDDDDEDDDDEDDDDDDDEDDDDDDDDDDVRRRVDRLRFKLPSNYEVREVSGSHRKPCIRRGMNNFYPGSFYVFIMSTRGGQTSSAFNAQRCILVVMMKKMMNIEKTRRTSQCQLPFTPTAARTTQPGGNCGHRWCQAIGGSCT
jgi:hypothetical protein